MPGGFDINVNLLHTPNDEHAFYDLFFGGEELDPLPDPSVLLIFINIPGFEYVRRQSDFSGDAERNILDVIGGIRRDRLSGLLMTVFQACLSHSRVFDMPDEPGDADVWDFEARLDLFYYNVLEQVKTTVMKAGGFSLSTGEDGADPRDDPGDIDALGIDTLEEIVKYITLTRIANVERWATVGETGPDTPLVRLVDDWIRRADVIAATRPRREFEIE